MDSFRHDLRIAVRALTRRPGFTLIAALSIALAMGFNAGIFSAVNALLLRSVPGVADPDRAVEVGRTRVGGSGFDSFSYPDFLDLRAEVPELDRLVAWRMLPVSWGSDEGGERITAMIATPGYFAALGVAPERGRAFGPAEDRPGVSEPVAIVSHRFWRERLGGDPAVLGTALDINRSRFTVIGVAPEGMNGHFPLVDVDVWLPFSRIDLAEPTFDPGSFRRRGSISHNVIGRLADGVSVERADAAVRAVMARLAEAYPETNAERSARVMPLGPIPGGGRSAVAGFLGALTALVALVLVVAAANVGGMLLARGAAREKEVAIRLALGSGRGRLVRQLLLEASLLFLLGAAGGLVIAYWATSLVGQVSGPGLQITLDLAPDATVLLFAVATALATGLLFGLVPALQLTRPALVQGLKDEGRTGRRGSRSRRVFVAVQVGLALVLVTAGGLLVRSLAEARAASAGFVPDGVHLVSLDLSLDGYSPADATVFEARMLRAIGAAPDVDAAALALDLPMDMSEFGGPVWPEGWDDPDGRGYTVDMNVVSDGYFETLRIPILRGRGFAEADRYGSEPVAVVSERFAGDVWGDADPIGRRLRWMSADAEERVVVGVVGEVKNQSLGESPDGMVYVPLAQEARTGVHVLARGPGVGAGLLRRTLLDLDPRLAVGMPQTLADITAVGLLPSRVAAWIAGLLGGLGLFLAALGIYGVVAHGVEQRRREIGVRMAVGASAGRVLRSVLGDGIRLALPGIALGGVAALAVARLIRGLLFGVSAADPANLAAVAVLITAVVGLASVIPARRAASVEPADVLRGE
ncbi:MAG: ABC transporter permease [Gemmatimonadota bacterium]